MTAHNESLVSLRHGRTTVVLDPVGAAVLAIDAGDVKLLAPSPDRAARDAEFFGSILAPWPNRLRDGLLALDGEEHRFPCNDAATGTALHGLWAASPFEVARSSPESAELRLEVAAGDAGWPSGALLSANWTATEGGAKCDVRLVNTGPIAVPVGLGYHPYFEAGGPLDHASLVIDADQRVVADDRLLPVGQTQRPDRRVALEGVGLDTTFVSTDETGASITLHRADGNRVHIWTQGTRTWWQVFTADSLPEPRRRASIAIEPMTCPPDAFTQGEAKILAPGEAVELRWGITLESS